MRYLQEVYARCCEIRIAAWISPDMERARRVVIVHRGEEVGQAVGPPELALETLDEAAQDACSRQGWASFSVDPVVVDSTVPPPGLGCVACPPDQFTQATRYALGDQPVCEACWAGELEPEPVLVPVAPTSKRGRVTRA